MGIFSSIGKALGGALSSTPVIGSAIGAVGGLLSSSQNSNAQLNAVREQNRGNMALAQYQFDRNLDMWNRQNDYNSPSAQMERYREAGLNPNLIYGSSSSAGNASSAPQFEAPHMAAAVRNRPDYGAIIGNSISQYNQLKLQQEQLELLRAQKQKTLSDANFLETRNLLGIQSFGFNSKYNPLRINLAAQTLSNMKINANLMGSKIEYLGQQIELARANLESIKASTEMTKYQKEFLVRTEKQRIRLLTAQAFGEQARANIDNKNWQIFRDTGVSPSDFNGGLGSVIGKVGLRAWPSLKSIFSGSPTTWFPRMLLPFLN